MSEDTLETLIEPARDYLDKNNFEIETTVCLSEAQFDILEYGLIISHPHTRRGCCMPLIIKANEQGIPIVFTYRTTTSETQTLRAISDRFQIQIENSGLCEPEFYTDLIRSSEGKF